MSNPTKKKRKIRLNLDVSHQVKSRIDRIQTKSDGASITEVVRRALAVFELVLEVREEGGRLVIMNKDGSSQELVIL